MCLYKCLNERLTAANQTCTWDWQGRRTLGKPRATSKAPWKLWGLFRHINKSNWSYPIFPPLITICDAMYEYLYVFGKMGMTFW